MSILTTGIVCTFYTSLVSRFGPFQFLSFRLPFNSFPSFPSQYRWRPFLFLPFHIFSCCFSPSNFLPSLLSPSIPCVVFPLLPFLSLLFPFLPFSFSPIHSSSFFLPFFPLHPLASLWFPTFFSIIFFFSFVHLISFISFPSFFCVAFLLFLPHHLRYFFPLPSLPLPFLPLSFLCFSIPFFPHSFFIQCLGWTEGRDLDRRIPGLYHVSRPGYSGNRGKHGSRRNYPCVGNQQRIWPLELL